MTDTSVEAEPIRFDPDRLTFGDLEDFESATGTSLLGVYDRLRSESDVSVKELIAFVWVVKRLDDPTLELSDVRAMRVTSFDIELTSDTPG
jgi:hypothetical protein